jgi:hypothetical protein
MQDALAIARTSRDPRIRRKFAIVEQWKYKLAMAKKVTLLMNAYMEPLDNSLEEQIACFAIKKWNKHHERYKEIFSNLDASNKEVRRLRRQIQNKREEIALAHGFTIDD